MSRELDRRIISINRLTDSRRAELTTRAEVVSNELPGAHRVRIERFDAVTGNFSAVVSENSPAEAGNYVQRALSHVQRIGRLGLEANQPAEFVADPNFQCTSSGAVAVHLQQQFKSITIFQSTQVVRFTPDGAIQDVVGILVSVDQDLTVSPRLAIAEAVRKAAEHVGTPTADEQDQRDVFGEPLIPAQVDLTGFVPRIITTFQGQPEQATLLEHGPFEENIRAQLTWFALDGGLRLTWHILITFPNFDAQYRVLVDADNGDILYCHQLVRTVVARANVYRKDGGTAREMTDLPQPLIDYALPIPSNLPTGFPDHWVTQNQTVGNSTYAHLGVTGSVVRGSVQEEVLQFNPTDATGDDQRVLNIFYYNCVMHDCFYLLGFRESDGNFQEDNLGRGGLAADRVDARAHSGAINGTANMATPIEGRGPVMNMGLVNSTGRHTAFDSSVVFHEFTHGVTNRFVGGPLNAEALDAPQSSGMGEGWSDYIACTINDTTVVGAWVLNDARGIRKFAYDGNFPDTFANIGEGRYNEPHNIGEIWCATLMELNRKIGKLLTLQLIVDALKLMPANPSFLDARDAFFLALSAKLAAGQLTSSEHGRLQSEAWKVYARFGMGPRAQSIGATISGIEPDFETPTAGSMPATQVQVETSPELAIPDNNTTGISSRLAVSELGTISHVSIGVDIAHTYIGDLRVIITAPSGTRMVLHERAGGSMRDLVASYSDTKLTALSALRGQLVRGDWVLQVIDEASQDEGVLRRWSLTVELAAATDVVRNEVSPSLIIPDNDPVGVSSPLSISNTGVARSVKVAVDITHTFVADLRLALISPTGRSALLQDRAAGDNDNLITSYDSGSSATLAALVGLPIQGVWTLRVVDLIRGDVGMLNRWQLEIGL
ncbi:MAG: M36 family metallopeptidase [Nitrospira sp.]|nr:M36 family metallopeptidase [Nitrospira sp.]